MANMKIISLIEHRAMQSHAEVAAIAQDVYAALTAITEPLRERIEALEQENRRQHLSVTGVEPYE